MEKLNKVFKASSIAEIDKYTIEHEPISSLLLMERVAHVFVERLLKNVEIGDSYVVVAGYGNNGGDGFAIARLLRKRGMEVEVFLVGEGGRFSEECKVNYERWRWGLTVVTRVEEFALSETAVVLDALFGSGLNRAVTGVCAEVIGKLNSLSNRVVAVDIPSGLMGEDNGANDRTAIVHADYTFTFQFPKVAFLLPENEVYVGEWHVLDIGLLVEEEMTTSYYYATVEQVGRMLPRAGKFAHKGTNGHGLLVAGSFGMMGAAVLGAKAAVRSGVGLLTCHVPRSGVDILQIAVPEALADGDVADCFSAVKIGEHYTAVAVGSGIGRDALTVAGVGRLLQEWRGVTVLDADALNILSEHREMLDLLHEGCILTPHVKEFERLAGKSGNDFERLNKLSNFAIRYKVCIVLKGAYTTVVSPSGDFHFNMTGNPGMAKGGSGDVLTGVLLALTANGIEPVEAAIIGVCAHGLSGDIVAEREGERGVCAGLLAEGMGAAWRKLESEHCVSGLYLNE